MIWHDKTKRITIGRIKKHKWYNGETLNQKQLIKELKALHKKMTIERKIAEKKAQELNNSITRDIGLESKTVIIHIKDYSSDDNADDNNEDKNDTNDDYSKFKHFTSGDTISGVGSVLKGVLVSRKAEIAVDFTQFIIDKFVDIDACEIYCNNVVSTLLNMDHSSFSNDIQSKIQEIDQAGDGVVRVEYYEETVDCIAPLFPDNEEISFTDMFSQYQPKFTLQHIQSVVINRGGTASIDLQDCSINAKMESHNFPLPVWLTIRVYYYEKYSAYIVRFNRISGDNLGFIRLLRAVIPHAGYVLNGLSDEQYKIDDNNIEIDDDNLNAKDDGSPDTQDDEKENKFEVDDNQQEQHNDT